MQPIVQATRKVNDNTEPKKGTDYYLSLIFLWAAFIVFMLMLIKAGLMVWRYSAVQMIKIDGDLKYVNRDLINSRVAPLIKGHYFTVNLHKIQKEVVNAPWVDEAIVSKMWPNGVRIYIRERQPVALWGGGGLISSKGDLFVPTSQVNTDQLPILFGPGNKGAFAMEQYNAMNAILRNLGMKIVELQLTDRMSWFLRMDNGIRLVVDQVDTIEKLQRFASLYEKDLHEHVQNIVSVDLRYQNGIAVAWKVLPAQKKVSGV
jgi:cell division protein FtsQ